MEPLLSICLPVYNRIAAFQTTFEKLLQQTDKYDINKVEIVVSINPAEDGNEEMQNYVKEMAKKYLFRYYVNSNNIGGYANLLQTTRLANGKYIWIIGDDDLLVSGTVDKVVNVLTRHSDVTWIYLNESRVFGAIEDKNSKLHFVKRYNGKANGYFANGKDAILQMLRKNDSGVLFSSSNIYLRSSVEKILPDYCADNWCMQVAFELESANHGAAYIFSEPHIIAGGVTTWKDQENRVVLGDYNEAVLKAVGHGYSQKELQSAIGYRMRHSALFIWFMIYYAILKGDSQGKRGFDICIHNIPFTTILITIFLPFIAVYLYFRSRYRKYKRKVKIALYRKKKDANPDILLFC